MIPDFFLGIGALSFEKIISIRTDAGVIEVQYSDRLEFWDFNNRYLGNAPHKMWRVNRGKK